MKRIIITILSIVVAGALISWMLVKNKQENQAKTDIVSQTDNLIAVTVEPVVKQPIKLDFTSNGNFSAIQDLELKSEASGKITRILVDKGARVTKGQVLAVIESEVASLDVKRAEDSYQKLKTDYQRYTSSFETGGVTKAQLDEIDLALQNAEVQLQQAKKRLGDATIKAPISGIINDRFIEVGSFVAPGTQLFEIVDTSFLKLNVTANEYQVVHIKKGDSVSITSKVFPDATFKGTVDFVAEKSDNALNYPIEIVLKNSQGLPLKSGMYATAKFEFPEENPQIVIDRNAFVGSVNSNQIYVYAENNQTAELRNVIAGRIIGGQVEIVSGLNEGEKVITSGQINLSDGAKVEVVSID